MVDHSETKSLVRLHHHTARPSHSNYFANSLDPKIARIFKDDIDIRHGLDAGRCSQYRPGSRDDEIHGAWNAYPTAL